MKFSIFIFVICILFLLSQLTQATKLPKANVDLVVVLHKAYLKKGVRGAKITSFVEKIVNQFNSNTTRVATVSFNMQPSRTIGFSFNNPFSDISNTVMLDMGWAMQEARTKMFSQARSNAKKVLIVFSWYTGRKLKSDLDKIRKEVKELTKMNVTIIPVGFGRQTHPFIKKSLKAASQDGKFIYVNYVNELRKKAFTPVMEALSTVICGSKKSEQVLDGPCFQGTQSRLHVKNYHTSATCEKEMYYTYRSCHKSQWVQCEPVHTDVDQDCINDKRKITTEWSEYNRELEECEGKLAVQTINCGKVKKCTNAQADVIIVMDESGSVTSEGWQKEVNFVLNLLKQLNIGQDKMHFGIISFGSSAYVKFPLKGYTYSSSLVQEIRSKLTFANGDDTITAGALKVAQQELARNGRKGVMKLLILITDGKSANQGETVAEATKLRNIGVEIMSVGVGNVNKNELNLCSSPPIKDNVIMVANFAVMSQKIDKISQQSCIMTMPKPPALCDLPLRRNISDCLAGTRRITEVSYKWETAPDGKKLCKLHNASRVINNCELDCHDANNGNVYTNGESWESDTCQKFTCSRSKKSVYNLLIPTAKGCKGIEGCHSATNEATQKFSCADSSSTSHTKYKECYCLINGKPNKSKLRIVTQRF